MPPRLHTTLPVIALLVLLAACSPSPPPYTGGRVETLQAIDVTQGEGRAARAGDTLTVHYTGWLYDESAPGQRGARFDSSHDRGQPLPILLGAGRVIRGWDEGLVGMREGGRRILLIPPEDAYGARGAGNRIPPGASLVFEVDLVEVAD